MKIVTYFKSLSEEQKKAFASRAGTSAGYLRSHILGGKKGFRKRPKDELIIKLVNATEGHVSLDEAIDYFLVQPVRKLAAELGQCSQNELMPPESALEMKALDRPHQRSECGYEGDRAGL